MRKPLVCANWKMNHTLEDGIDFFKRFESAKPDIADRDVVVFPSFPLIYPLKDAAISLGIRLGGQNIHENPKGAFTGEVSSHILKSSGASWVIIGHSERREKFEESDELISRKLKAAISVDLNAILCVGEQLETRESGNTRQFVKNQLNINVQHLSNDEMKFLTIAYETVWAIGTGLASNPDDAQDMMSFIRNWLEERFDRDVADNTRILYGGSVKSENMSGYAAMPDIDGALVGGASLDPESFASIVMEA